MRLSERRWPAVDVVWLLVAFLCGVVSLALVVGVTMGWGAQGDGGMPPAAAEPAPSGERLDDEPATPSPSVPVPSPSPSISASGEASPSSSPTAPGQRGTTGGSGDPTTRPPGQPAAPTTAPTTTAPTTSAPTPTAPQPTATATPSPTATPTPSPTQRPGKGRKPSTPPQDEQAPG